MSGVPCPYCKAPIGLDMKFIIENPVSQCPHCETILKFNLNDDIIEKYNKVINDIKSIKKQYSGFTYR